MAKAQRNRTLTCLKRRAIRISQQPEHPLYLFSLTGEELLQIAAVSRISRDDTGKLLGYQRPEVKRHIQDIVDYLDSDAPLFVHPIILALTSQVKFRSSRGPDVSDGCATSGSLEIPIHKDGTRKPAWIVDGQQRALALSKCRRKSLSIPISAFVADNVDLQRDQFLRVNSARPLPRGLITELLPEVFTPLPARMATRRIPSAICDWLNQAEESPFESLIKRTSTPDIAKQKAVVTDTSIVKMVEESLSSPSGCLFPYRNIASGETDFDGICKLLCTYWTAVREAFPTAWGRPPSKSRLMHGAGIRAMGRLMDKIMPTVRLDKSKAIQQVRKELQLVAPICRWTSGNWELLDGLRWNQVQNVPRHINLLSNVLIREYTQARQGAR
jgi:DGQHR domain-containing protein